jgi:hypothetical protein
MSISSARFFESSATVSNQQSLLILVFAVRCSHWGLGPLGAFGSQMNDCLPPQRVILDSATHCQYTKDISGYEMESSFSTSLKQRTKIDLNLLACTVGICTRERPPPDFSIGFFTLTTWETTSSYNIASHLVGQLSLITNSVFSRHS